MTQMTVELLKSTLPKALQGSATQEFADHINNIALDPEVAEEVRSNFLSYTKVLQEGKFKTESYLDAVTYVTHKLMGYSNQDAYIRTFPQRYQALVAKGVSSKDLSAYVAAYHSNKLVNLILEQSIVPSWLLNRDIYQRAINTQFELMTDVNVSAKVRSDAANSILTHLKQPEAQKIELQVGMKDKGGLEDLMSHMRQLAKQQQELIQLGVPARDVARQGLMGAGAGGPGTRAGEVIEDAEFSEVPNPEPNYGVGTARSTASQMVEGVTEGRATTRPEILAGPQPGNPGVPPRHPSLFGGSLPSSSPQPSGERQPVQSEKAPGDAPGATAAQPPACAEGEEAGDFERGSGAARSHEAASRGRVSLFDPQSFPAGADA